MQDCKREEFIHSEQFPSGMAYVPWQNWTTIYELDKGYEIGTIFPELNKPFNGRRVCK